MNQNLSAALDYLHRGMSVIPLVERNKFPLIPWAEFQNRRPSEAEIRAWFETLPGSRVHYWSKDSEPKVILFEMDPALPPAGWWAFLEGRDPKHVKTKTWPKSPNLGLATGSISGVIAVDADGPQGIQWVKDHMPKTGVYQRTGKGWHAFYRQNGTKVPNTVRLVPEVDVRGDGGYVVIAPSIHPSGRKYELEIMEGGWDNLTNYAVPKSVPPVPPIENGTVGQNEETKSGQGLTAENRGTSLGQAVGQRDNIPQGQRDDTLTRMVGHWFHKGLERDEVLTLARIANQERCKPPLPDADVLRIVDSIGKRDQANAPIPPQGFTLSELMETEFPEPKWAVDGLIPEGLTFIAGKPKLGKSWLALSLIVAISSGGRALGQIDVDQGTALYLALEDTPRRMQSRCAMVLQGSTAPTSAHVFTAWPRMGEGGISLLDRFLSEHSDTRIIVIDTWARFQPRRSGKAKGNPYLDDYADAGRVKELADKHGVAIVVIHHTRKADAEDSFDMVSGTTGLTGAADTTMLLDRARNQADAILKVTGRDIDERELALQLHKESMTWQVLGDAEDYKRTTERQRIIEVMRETGEPMKPADIAMEMGIARDKTGSIRRLLVKMRDQGEVIQSEYGKYILPESRSNTGNSGNSSLGMPVITQEKLLPVEKTGGNSASRFKTVTGVTTVTAPMDDLDEVVI